MKRLKLPLIMTSMMSLTSLTGCSILGEPEQPVYMPAGSVAEVAEPVAVVCWVTNKETGKIEKRKFNVLPGQAVGRPRLDTIGKEVTAQRKEDQLPKLPDLPENQKPIK